jgi:hypothetical protein
MPKWGSNQLPYESPDDANGNVGHETKTCSLHDLARELSCDKSDEQNDE